MNLARSISCDRINVFAKILAGIILQFFLVNIPNVSNVSIDNCFNIRSGPLICTNHMTFIHFGYFVNYRGLQRFYRVMGALIDFLLDYISYVVVQWIQVPTSQRPYFGGDMTLEVVSHQFLGCLGLMRR